MSNFKITPHAESVLRFMLTKPMDATWARELTQNTGLPNGTLLPILTRMLQQGWVERYWENDEEAEAERRPRRRYYRLTREGQQEARVELAQLSAARSRMTPGSARPQTAEGAGT
ncbi:helix-turn-helix transcriptional regulator [Streptomyces sp. NPDC088910]|uniref:helix-turn-helix transcriptional regulator n=1 Tax=Streptomyces sp. NPDC088910 TaxID=3365911 RepID=UPI0037FD7C04